MLMRGLTVCLHIFQISLVKQKLLINIDLLKNYYQKLKHVYQTEKDVLKECNIHTQQLIFLKLLFLFRR